jgi:polysaccharide biosynthesis protein PslH
MSGQTLPQAVLYLTTELPWPATSGGRVRSLAELSLLGSLPEVSEIHVVCLREEEVAERTLRELEDAVPKALVEMPVFHPIHLKAFPRYIPRVLWRRALGEPYLAGKWASPAVVEALETAVRRRDFAVVYIDHLGMMRYEKLLRRLLPQARFVLEQHNVESDFFRQFASRAPLALKPAALLEFRLARRFEMAAMRKVDAVVAISHEDARTFRAMAGVEAVVVPQRVAFDANRPFAPTAREILYVGNLSWRPNVEGLDWFFREVWPRARARDASLRLSIAGSGLKKDAAGSPVVPELWRQPGVTIRGFVDDLGPLYAKASVLVAPIVGGSGVRIKLLEGMAYGVPVVTTRDGAAGLPIRAGVEAEIETNPDAFAERMVALASDEGRGSRLRTAAFAFLEAHHSTAACGAAMRRALAL